MPAHTRTRRQIESDRAEIARLYLKGNSQFRIAEIMATNTSRPFTRELIKYDIGCIKNEWRKSAVFDFNLKVQEELNRIDLIENEMWEAWERSKNPRDITSTRSKRRELQVQTRGQNGQADTTARMPVDSTNEANKRTEQRDPVEAYMARIAWCVEMRAKLLGLIAPTEIRHSGTVTQITEVFYEGVQGNPDARMMVIGGPRPALEEGKSNGHVAVIGGDDDNEALLEDDDEAAED